MLVWNNALKIHQKPWIAEVCLSWYYLVVVIEDGDLFAFAVDRVLGRVAGDVMLNCLTHFIAVTVFEMNHVLQAEEISA